MKYLFLFISVITVSFSSVFAQPGVSGLELEKPAKYESRRLASEKTGETRFSLPKRFIQNNITHYNYYFNANARLREIIERAKAGFRDDYTRLLPFYNYDLETTAQYRQDLDSVIYKATAGILLHDLRNSFIDNLYLLIGESYFFRNQLDSAYLTFQYLNYAFSPKEKDGWDMVIGSNANEGGNVFSVATKENNSIFNRVLTRPPSRNESFIWQIRTLLAAGRTGEAAGLLETFKQDPLFPERLQTDLKEMQALYFYQQKIYDSAAFYLTQALDNAGTPLEQARWEYLIAQLHDLSGNHELARAFFKRASLHTLDPLLEVYAILNALSQNETGSEADVKAAVYGLLKMARKDKYRLYRDIIYYTAAEIEAGHERPEAAEKWLQKSVQYSVNNPPQRNLSYLALADIALSQKKYVAAKGYYDSVNITLLSPDSADVFTNRKTALDNVVLPKQVVERQDSLLRIAALPEEEREAFVKALARKLRKGDKNNRAEGGMGLVNESIGRKAVNLFGEPGSKGEAYFNNASLKTKGHAAFKAAWGDRPNADNWRRSSAVSTQPNLNELNNPASDLPGGSDLPPDNSYEGLMARLPLTDLAKKIVQDSTEQALFALGKAYQNGFEEYLPAIAAYERLLSTFPETAHAEEAWFNLYYCYGKNGNTAAQLQAKKILTSRFGDGNYTLKLSSTDQGISPDSLYRKEVTDAYNKIYDLFIQGRFTEAVAAKKAADSRFGQNKWTPQLLYIEAVYYIRQRHDSIATDLLKKIVALSPADPLAEKSQALLDVLSRRQEIETYLTNLEIKRPDDADENKVVIANRTVQPITGPVRKPQQLNKDSLNPSAPIVAAPARDSLTASAPTAKVPDSSAAAKAAADPLPTDAVRAGDSPAAIFYDYPKTPESVHLVALVLTNVDPVYVTEARNAFNRYNRENYYKDPIESGPLALTDSIKLVLFQDFDNAPAAYEYIRKARELAEKQIIPWLKPDKYSFILISSDNLELLKNRKDMRVYRLFLKAAYPELDF